MRLFRLLLAPALAGLLAGCGGQSAAPATKKFEAGGHGDAAARAAPDGGAALDAAPTAAAPGAAGGPAAGPAAPGAPGAKAPGGMMDDARAGVTRRGRTASAPAGVVTAGSFDDNAFPQFFRTFANRAGQNPHVGGVVGRFLGRRVEVLVTNGKGETVGNARVRVAAADSQAGVDLVTRSDGRAVFVSTLDNVDASGVLTVTATAAGQPPVTRALPPGEDRCPVVVPGASGERPNALDLAVVLDTTGSMSDEISYLTAEATAIAAGVRARFPNVSQRYGLVCYRDRGAGEQYLTRPFDFTPDVEQFRANLAAQSAGGGGDTPEALDAGLADANNFQWRAGNTARVVLLVADAPAHAAQAAAAVEHVKALRAKGVVVYPVFASSNDPPASEAAEVFMRGAALATGGRYVFLTDDSGVGGSHAEPHLPHYHVEKLTGLLARIISDELAGRRTDPDPQTVVRTVGQPPAYAKGQ